MYLYIHHINDTGEIFDQKLIFLDEKNMTVISFIISYISNFYNHITFAHEN